ncbi:MAG: class I tRNA ligase family protein, partial [Oscillospiraceae bacterium]|nr:class I tRNA ligase family protein [Oscillospiraceae bacterium]
DSLKPNTAIAALMGLLNQIDKTCNLAELKTFLQLLSPFAPHICDELWEQKGFDGICSVTAWPEYDESKTVESMKEIAVQVGGKLKTTVFVPVDCEDDVVIEAAKADEKIQHIMQGKEIVRAIVVKNRLVNLILK